jgi:hypothetical protein
MLQNNANEMVHFVCVCSQWCRAIEHIRDDSLDHIGCVNAAFCGLQKHGKKLLIYCKYLQKGA